MQKLPPRGYKSPNKQFLDELITETVNKPINKQKASKFIRKEIHRIDNRIPLELSTHYLAANLSNKCLKYFEEGPEMDNNRKKKIIQTCVLLAGKLSERDINIPTVSDIKIAGGKDKK